MEYQNVKQLVNDNFYFVIKSLNVPLVYFVKNAINIKINGLFNGFTALQIIVDYLKNYPNINNEFAYEMFDYLITIGVDIERDSNERDIYFEITRIKDQNIQFKLLQNVLLLSKKERATI